MNVTPEQLAAFAAQMAKLASIFNPGAATSIQMLILAGTQLNEMIQAIKAQTVENAPEVWEAVRKDFAGALAEFEASGPKL